VVTRDSNLESILQAVEPAVRLVPERYYREVIHYLTDRDNPQPSNTNLPCWVSRETIVSAELLPSHMLGGTEPYLLLITEPDDRMIDHLPIEQQLLIYWRVLFQAAVMRAIDRTVQAGALTAQNCRDQLLKLGAPAVREIRYVLEMEHLVSREADDLGRYRAFAAVYWDLVQFAPQAIEDYFPSLPPVATVVGVLGENIDAGEFVAVTRPAGAAEPPREPEPHELWETPEHPTILPPIPPEDPRGLLRRAAEAESKGNNVRAAIVRTQAALTLNESDREVATSEARKALGKLVDSLAPMFNWDDDTRQEWRQALTPLLLPAAAGIWPRAARCLYELQKLPADLSREVYAVDLPEAIRTWGRRPIKRALPHARPVLILMGLKRAQAQMLRAELSRSDQLRLDRLFHHQIHQLEHSIRQDFTPLLTQALAEARLVPASQVEWVARDKLVAELLDRVCDRGYLRFGDLRDAIARNQLKMRDLDRTRDFFQGDTLLRADIQLANALEGVYRKGEFYLRWLQRLSAVFFGTPVGRWVTLFLAIPFLGAFLTLMFAEHVWHKVEGLINPQSVPSSSLNSEPSIQPLDLAGVPTPPERLITPEEVVVDDEGRIWWEPREPALQPIDEGNLFVGDWFRQAPAPALAQAVIPIPPQPTVHSHEEPTFLTDPAMIFGFGIFLLLVMHVLPFRRAVLLVLRHFGRAIRALFWELPLAIWRSNIIRVVRQSYAVRFLYRHFWSPLLITALLFGGMVLVGVRAWFLLKWGWAIWAGLTLAYNTPWGWIVQDRVTEAISDWWRVVRVNLIPGLIETFIIWFKRLGNWIERQLYAVDEWFRFRGGDSQGSLALKALLGVIWFPIAYLFRFVFYVLVEPQINPVKHFPVVTVSHKVIWPMVPDLARATGISPWTAGMIINGIPGVFGFIAWELRANWLLYAANRSDRLRPVIIGSHGESMRGLLRPGFHSGTIPKLFKKLRHSSAAQSGRLRYDLEHTAEAVHRFIDREWIAVLQRSSDWGGVRVHVQSVRFGCQRLTLELGAEELSRDAFVLSFENIAGQIEATIDQMGWADRLTSPQQAAFVASLRGVLDIAAVERIDGRERVESLVPLGTGFADLARRVGWEEWVNRWQSPAAYPRPTTSPTRV
jgi:hypothetical protein